MKIKKINGYGFIMCAFIASSASVVYGGTMGAASETPIDAIYVGAFGGGGSINSGHLRQEGTAFYPDSRGGPLAVNAIGDTNNSSAWVFGGHVGHRWSARSLHHMKSSWSVAPASELEGYYLGGSTLRGDDLNNGTTRLTEHFFRVSYPMQTGVFLVNAVLNAHHADFGKFHPYVGVGAGAAVISISGANSTQITPSEPGINHYNSGASDTSFAFAAQPKVGVSYQFSQNTNLFVEYRFLYLSDSDYTFGSTVYPTHVATSNWDVTIRSQYYNMGTIGIQYDL